MFPESESGARAGAEIWGDSRSPGWNASRFTPDAVPSAPPEGGAPHSPPLFTLRKHSSGVGPHTFPRHRRGVVVVDTAGKATRLESKGQLIRDQVLRT